VTKRHDPDAGEAGIDACLPAVAPPAPCLGALATALGEAIERRHRLGSTVPAQFAAVRAAAATRRRGRACDPTPPLFSESLHRADLTDAERRQHIAEWVRLTELKSPHDAAKSKTATNPRGSGRQEEAISRASRDLGISKDTVARAVAAESLPEPVKVAADAAGLSTVARARAVY
jgi:hypothetical protein